MCWAPYIKFYVVRFVTVHADSTELAGYLSVRHTEASMAGVVLSGKALAIKRFVFVALIVAALPCPGRAGVFGVFAPQRFVRNTGAPAMGSATFITLDPILTYTFRINSASASNAVITPNGVEVTWPGLPLRIQGGDCRLRQVNAVTGSGDLAA
jgi:hypothetical protein